MTRHMHVRDDVSSFLDRWKSRILDVWLYGRCDVRGGCPQKPYIGKDDLKSDTCYDGLRAGEGVSRSRYHASTWAMRSDSEHGRRRARMHMARGHLLQPKYVSMFTRGAPKRMSFANVLDPASFYLVTPRADAPLMYRCWYWGDRYAAEGGMLRPIFVEHVDADCWVERRTCVCQCVVGSEARLLMLSECAEDARESIKVLEIIEPYNQGELQPPRLFVSVITPHNHLDMKLSSLAVLCAAAFVSSTAAGVARRQSGGCECGS